MGARKKPRGGAEWSPAEVQGKPCRGEAKESAGKMTDKEIMPRRESGSLRVAVHLILGGGRFQASGGNVTIMGCFSDFGVGSVGSVNILGGYSLSIFS